MATINKNLVLPCSADDQKTYFNGLTITIGDLLTALNVLPAIQMMFGPTDTDPVSMLVPYAMQNTKLLIQPIDTTTKAASALASEITLDVTVNGTVKYNDVSTNGSNLVESVASDRIDLAKGDVICVAPSAAPGAGKQVLISLVGDWA